MKNLIRTIFLISLNVTYLLSEMITTNPRRDMAIFPFRMIDECFISDKGPIVIIGNQNDVLIKIIERLFGPTVIGLISLRTMVSEHQPETKVYIPDNYSEVHKPMPTNRFIINQVDLSSLKSSLQGIEESVWWNQEGYFLIIATHLINQCDQIDEYLKVVWTFDILNAIFLCPNSNHRMEYYTFNPFSVYAPNKWRLFHTSIQQNDHSFFLFKLRDAFIDSTSLCDAFIFDKTLDLGGYPIKLVGTPISDRSPYDPSQKVFKIRGAEGAYAELVWTKLNASVNLTVLSTDNYGVIHPNGTVDGILEDVLNGEYDYYYHISVDQRIWKNQLYLYTQTSMCFVTSKKAIAAHNHFRRMVKLDHLLIIFGIYILLVIVFRFLITESFSAASLDVIRALIGASTAHQPQSLAAKSLFILIILASMILTSYLESKVYSMIIKSEYEPFIDSELELIELGYKIYTTEYMSGFLHGTAVEDELIMIKNMFDCVHIIEEVEKSTCVCQCAILSYEVIEDSKTHIAKFLGYNSEYAVLTHRNRFSLRRRINRIIRHAQEAGILSYLLDYQHFLYYKKDNETLMLQRITLNHASPGFMFLIDNFILSLLIFAIEHLIAFLRRKRIVIYKLLVRRSN